MSDKKLLTAFEYFEGDKPIETVDITNLDRIHAAVCGEPKTGKSSIIARTARKPLLVLDGDDRRESIAGLEDVYVKTLIDTEHTNPIAWNELEKIIANLTYAKTQNKLDIKSISIDSMTYWRKYAEHQFLNDSTGSSRAIFKVGQLKYLIPKDWDVVSGVQAMLETLFIRLFALDIDVYATFHTRPEKDQAKSTKTDFVYKDNLTVEPPNLKMILPKFNDVWRTFVEDGEYKVQLKPDYVFNASTVLKNVENVEKADIQELIKKHNSK